MGIVWLESGGLHQEHTGLSAAEYESCGNILQGLIFNVFMILKKEKSLLIIWRHIVLEWLDILFGGSKGSISSIYSEEQGSPRMNKRKKCFYLTAIFAYPFIVHGPSYTVVYIRLS